MAFTLLNAAWATFFSKLRSRTVELPLQITRLSRGLEKPRVSCYLLWLRFVTGAAAQGSSSFHLLWVPHANNPPLPAQQLGLVLAEEESPRGEGLGPALLVEAHSVFGFPVLASPPCHNKRGFKMVGSCGKLVFVSS